MKTFKDILTEVSREGITLTWGEVVSLYRHFYKKDMPKDMPFAEAGQKMMNDFGKAGIEKAIKKVNRTIKIKPLKERFKMQIVRTAYMPTGIQRDKFRPPESHATLEWKMVNPQGRDSGVNYKLMADLAWGELQKLKRKGVLDFYESDFNVTSSLKPGDELPHEYNADIRLIKFDPEKLPKELKRFKFKIKKL